MQLIFDSGGGDHEVDLRVNDPAATVADLAAALGGTPGGGLLVGEHFARGDLALTEAGLHEGAVLRPAAGPGAGAAPAPAGLELRVVGGPDAGVAVPLSAGEVVVGRDPTAGVVLGVGTVSRRHCRVSVTPQGVSVADLGSTAGTLVDGSPADPARTLAPWSVVEVGSPEQGAPLGGLQVLRRVQGAAVLERIRVREEGRRAGHRAGRALRRRGRRRAFSTTSIRSADRGPADPCHGDIPPRILPSRAPGAQRRTGRMIEQTALSAAGTLAEGGRLKLRTVDTAEGTERVWTGQHYEGPLGPIEAVYEQGKTVTRISGPNVPDGMVNWGIDLRRNEGNPPPLSLGVSGRIGDTDLRLSRQALAYRRSTAAVRIEGGGRSWVLRRRGMSNCSLERQDGSRVGWFMGWAGANGAVNAGADALEVALLVLTAAAGFQDIPQPKNWTSANPWF